MHIINLTLLKVTIFLLVYYIDIIEDNSRIKRRVEDVDTISKLKFKFLRQSSDIYLEKTF